MYRITGAKCLVLFLCAATALQAENSPKTTTFGAWNGPIPGPKPKKARSFRTPLDPKDLTRRPVFGFGDWDTS